MRIGISCYPVYGGSGVVATELGIELARRGHEVHFITYAMPFRLSHFVENVFYHEVEIPSYPLFDHPPYSLALTVAMHNTAMKHDLDLIHAHYAVPHATAAFLSRQVLAGAGSRTAPKVVTTLHGTDITLVGNDSSYSQIVAFSIQESDSVTAVSASLRDATYEMLGITRGIEVIPNFLDCSIHRRRPRSDLRKRFNGGDDATKIVTHVSNFRPVKRVDAVIDIFDRIRQQVPARLLLVGDGPDLALAYKRARELGITPLVHGVGAQEEVVPLLSISDVFLLPSSQESFGLAALEAMACEVPVVASRVGGLPEVIQHGVSGYLHPPEAINDMAASAVSLLTDEELHERVSQAACRRVRQEFCVDRVVPMYEACYRAVM